MLKFIIILLMSLLLSQASVIPAALESDQNELASRIVGGEVISILRHSYQISLRVRNGIYSAYTHLCGGSLLDNRTIITAAHCVYNRHASNLVVVAGTEYRAATNGVITRIAKIVIHEAYNASIMDHDVALVFLEPEIQLNNETIATIELSTVAPQDGDIATVVGWGTTTEGGFASRLLLQVQVPIVANDKCQIDYDCYPITNAMLCAGLSSGGRGSCNGDSGGPLVVNNQLAGIVSWGRGCAKPGYPDVYASVTHVIDWIAQKLSENA